MFNLKFRSTIHVLSTTTTLATLLFATGASLEANAAMTWTRCASEGGTCNFSGSKSVRYGANGVYATKTLTGPVACTNAVFGDPVYGTVKACDYSDAAVTGGGTTPTTRNVLKWPFAATSIWNMPIGSGAAYVAANLPAVPGGDVWSPMPMIDDERIVLRPQATVTPINYSSAAWSGANRCSGTGGQLVSVPMPSDFVVANSGANESAAFLQPDGRTIMQVQPLARCYAGGPATSYAKFNPVDIYGDGASGAHGGSGLSAIGGSIRVGELRPGGQGPRHALKLVVYAKQVLYRCGSYAQCYRWPATNADSYAVGFYGTDGGNGNTAMKMGALLAIPASRDINAMGMETDPGKQLAWTLQNYGAYIVDDSYGPGFGFAAENGPDGSMRNQFQADYGYALSQRANGNTPWTRDVQRLQQALNVVDNNGPNSIGGGGTPRQPLAPAYQ